MQNGIRPPPLSSEERQITSSILAFETLLRNLITRESARDRNGAESDSPPSDGAMVNGDVVVKKEEDLVDNLQSSRAVLTLYGNAGAQGPKQLFSSLQKPMQVRPSTPLAILNRPDSNVDVVAPLRESNLPNMISTTKVVPVHPDEALNGKKEGPTFQDIFHPPVTVLPLSPPKPSKHHTTKGTSVKWAHNSEIVPRSKKLGAYNFTTEKLATGQWLGYDGVDPTEAPTSPEAKRKQRDRALSTGEAKPRPSEGARAAMEQAKEEALFRSVYSSFAPSCDDTMALIPEQTKNQIWWHKIGEKRFQEVMAIDPALLSEAAEDATEHDNSATVAEEYDENEFKAAVEDFEPETFDINSKPTKDEILGDETEELLKEIGDLLETLYSHQRIRNASLAQSSRTPVSQNTPLMTMTGTPSEPSADELDVYGMLKNQLTVIIASLPPYAVAKLNGDQLAEMNISRSLVVEGKDYKGVMEEDQVARLQKQAALNAAVGPAPVSRAASSLQQQYSTPPSHQARSSGAHLLPNRPTQTGSSYFPQQQGPHRPPPLINHRSSSGLSQSYNAGSYSASTQRPPYNQQQYAQQPTRPAYGQTNSQYYQQRPHSGYGGYYQSTPQSQAQSRNYQQPPPSSAYQTRPPNGQTNPYAPSQSPHVRTQSPLKPAPPAPTQYTQSRPAYSTPAGQNGQYIPRPTSASYSSQPSTPSTLAPAGHQTPISTAEQQSIMERQRAQLNIQQQARGVAHPSINRQSSGTPQPNGHTPNQVNGTPMAT